MPYEYLDHVADVGLQATGETVAEALESAGQGLLDLLVDTSTVNPSKPTVIKAVATDLESLLVQFLNAILTQQDIERRFFNTISIGAVEQIGGVWHAEATLLGEPIDLDRHTVENEVKAATYSGLRAEVQPGHVLLRCVLDL